MEERQEYAVLKIVVHSDRCYMSADYIRGEPLVVWLRHHPGIPRTQLYDWIRKLAGDLEHFHECRGNPSYQYVNPYSMIVGEDDRVYLLDLGSSEQQEMLRLMQRRTVRERFLSPENRYYQKASVGEDIYGFGRTIQYLLSASVVEPALGRWEEIRFQRIVSGCVNRNMKRTFHSFGEITERLPAPKERRQKLPPVRKLLIAAAVVVVAGAAGLQAAGRTAERTEEKEGDVTGDLSDTDHNDREDIQDYTAQILQMQEQWDVEKQEMTEEYHARERELIYEIALLYFVELENYTRSGEIMEEAPEPGPFEQDFTKLCAYLDNRIPSVTERDMELLLERMKTEAPDPSDERYAYCIARGQEELAARRGESYEEGQDGTDEEAQAEEEPEASETAETD